MRKQLSFILFFLLILTLTGCLTFSPRVKIKEFHKEIEIEKDTLIYFENLQGNLEIIGWGKDNLEIYAIKNGTDSQIRQTDIEIKRKGENLYLKTYYPRGDLRRIFVDFELHVPQKAMFEEIRIEKGNLSSIQFYGKLKAFIDEGNIEIEDFSGTWEATTEKGYIVARIFENKKGDSLNLKTSSGDIHLYLPPKPDAQISAETRRGTISSDFIDEGEKKEPIKKWEEMFGKGEARIHIETQNGKIKIKKISQ